MPYKILHIAQAFRNGLTIQEVQIACQFDPWFLQQIKEIIDQEEILRSSGLPKKSSELFKLKKMGFSDSRISELTDREVSDVRMTLQRENVSPSYKRVDSCAGEFHQKPLFIFCI